ncbi:hypothetical protein ACU686_40805 [Yinghuangia aomiensis]
MEHVLTPGGGLGLVWNTYDDAVPWVRDYQEIYRSRAPEGLPSHQDGVSAGPVGRPAGLGRRAGTALPQPAAHAARRRRRTHAVQQPHRVPGRGRSGPRPARGRGRAGVAPGDAGAQPRGDPVHDGRLLDGPHREPTAPAGGAPQAERARRPGRRICTWAMSLSR